MAIHDLWSYDNAPQSSTDISQGTTLSYPNQGTYFQYTNLPGVLFKNTGGTGTITSDGFLNLISSASWNPALVVRQNDVQNWSTSTKYWMGFRTKTAQQSTATTKVFALADTVSQTNTVTILSESDLTTANAAALNTEYYVEVFIDRTNLVYQVYINGTQVKSGALTAASVPSGGTGYYFWGGINSAQATAGATRSFRDFYFLDVDGVDSQRLGPIRSSRATLSNITGTGWTLNNVPAKTAPVLAGSAAISTTVQKFGAGSVNIAGTSGAGVSIPNIAALQFTSDFTIEMWMYPTASNVNSALAGKGGQALLWWANGSRLQLTIDGSSGASINYTSSMTLNAWHHIALTRQGNLWTIWQDGVSVGTYTGTAADSWGNNANNLYIGNALDQSGWGVSNPAFPGQIDEVRVSNIARYTAGFTPSAAAFSSDVNTIALLHLDSNSGTTLVDSSSLAADLPTALGMALQSPPVTGPSAGAPANGAAITATLNTALATGTGIVAVQPQMSLIGDSVASNVMDVGLTQASVTVDTGRITLPVSANTFNQRWSIQRNAPDGGVWTPAKVNATVATLSPAAPKTVVLMHFNGANGSTTYTDDAGHTATGVGTVSISTAQSKFGGSALNIPAAAGNTVTIPDAPELRLTGDFTIEMFVYLTSFANNPVLISKGTNGFLEIGTGGGVIVNADAGGGNLFSTGAVMTLNTWTHIALTKASGSWRVFVNGALIGTVSSASTWGNVSNPLWIGNYQGSSSLYSTGWIDELRISNIARYTAAFTAPASPFVLD
jgi:hypothetical protein